MNIEIHQPELETLIQQRMATGRFRDVEDVLLQALQLQELKVVEMEIEPPNRNPVMSLREVFARARDILAGEELVIDRDPSPGRAVDLS